MASARDKREERRERVDAVVTANERRAEVGSRTVSLPQGASFFAPKKAGVYRIDIIPYRVTLGKETKGGNPRREKGKLHWERTYWVHRDVGPNKDAALCPRKCASGRCPVCDEISSMAQNPDIDPDIPKGMAAKERQLFNVIDLAEPDKGVQVWDMSFHLFGKLLYSKLENLEEEDQYRRYFADFDGSTLKITLTEKTMGKNKFLEVTDIEFKQRKEPYDDDIVDKAHNLDKLLKLLSYEDLLKQFTGDVESKKEKDDDDDAPTPPKRKVVDDDDDDVPAPKAKGKPSKDDDEDDDAPTPPKKKGKEEQTAEDLGIEVGTKVEYDGKKWEVFHVSGDGSSLRLKNLKDEDEVERGVDPNECTVIKGGKSAPKDDDDDDEDDDAPKAKSPQKSGKDTSVAAKKRATDDDDDDEDDSDDDDDDDTPAPKAKGGKTGSAGTSKQSKKAADDDDWD